MYVGFRVSTYGLYIYVYFLRAIARMLSGENCFKDDISVGYGVRRYYFSSFALSYTTLWVFSGPHETAVSQKFVRHDSVSTNCSLFFCKK